MLPRGGIDTANVTLGRDLVHEVGQHGRVACVIDCEAADMSRMSIARWHLSVGVVALAGWCLDGDIHPHDPWHLGFGVQPQTPEWVTMLLDTRPQKRRRVDDHGSSTGLTIG
jgi:hypothetical protein